MNRSPPIVGADGAVAPELACEDVRRLFALQEPGRARRLAECAAASLYAQLGDGIRRGVSSAVLRARPGARPGPAPRPPGREPGGRLAALCLSFDVDYRACFRSSLRLAEQIAAAGLPAAFYLILGGPYRLDAPTVRALLDMGHEVGVHALGYDLRLAYRSPRRILRRLHEAKHRLEDLAGRPVPGFRNHSLLWSGALIEQVEAAGFRYDSTLFARGGGHEPLAEFRLPFRYSGMRLWEIPVLWPLDTELFRRWGLADAEAAGVMRRRLDRAEAGAGVACIAHHPSIAARHPDYVAALLADIARRAVPVMTPADLAAALAAAQPLAAARPRQTAVAT